MSTLYELEVERVAGPIAVVRVTVVHPDCELPPTGAKDFALQILWDLSERAAGPLADAVTVEQICDEAFFTRACVDYVIDVQRQSTRNYVPGRSPSFRPSAGDAELPVGVYEIQATDARWLGGLRSGLVSDSAAWSLLPDRAPAPVDVPGPARDWPLPPIGARVEFKHNPQVAGGDARRGSVVGHGEAAGRTNHATGWNLPPPPQSCVRVQLDQGLEVWGFVDSVIQLADDTYERAWADPESFFGALLATPPLARCQVMHRIALGEGAGIGFQVRDAAGAATQVIVCDSSFRFYALLRRLPLARGCNIALLLLEGWLDDTAHHATRFEQPVQGVEYAAGWEALPYHRIYSSPIKLALSTLVLLVLDEVRRAPFQRLEERLSAEQLALLRRLLVPLADLFLGTPASALFPERPLLASWLSDGVPTGVIDVQMFDGYPHLRDQSTAAGLSPPACLVQPHDFDDD